MSEDSNGNTSGDNSPSAPPRVVLDRTQKKRLLLIALLVGLGTLAADQGSKQWARGRLQGDAQGISVIDNYFDLQYHENPGMAFGIGRKWKHGRYILLLIGMGVLVMVWRIVGQTERRHTLAYTAFGMVAGGAIGNMIDRVYIGRVVDFIVMHYQRKYTWPAYNIADAMLCVGVGLLMIAVGARAVHNDESASSTARNA